MAPSSGSACGPRSRRPVELGLDSAADPRGHRATDRSSAPARRLTSWSTSEGKRPDAGWQTDRVPREYEPPPPKILQWVAHHVHPRARVTAVAPLPGGITAGIGPSQRRFPAAFVAHPEV
jgi:hypothetical protein